MYLDRETFVFTWHGQFFGDRSDSSLWSVYSIDWNQLAQEVLFWVHINAWVFYFIYGLSFRCSIDLSGSILQTSSFWGWKRNWLCDTLNICTYVSAPIHTYVNAPNYLLLCFAILWYLNSNVKLKLFWIGLIHIW